MNRRWLWIILGVIAFFTVLFAGAVGGAGITYLVMQTRPVRAAVEIGIDSQTDPGSEAGVLVAAVVPGSPAEEAGLQRGDIILEIDGAAVNSPLDLHEAIQTKEAGDTIEVSVQRGSERLTYSVELGEQDGQAYLGVQPCGGLFFGMGPLGGRLGPFVAGEPAFLITRVIPDSQADKAGLQEGDRIVGIDGEPVETGQRLADIIQTREPGDRIELEVIRPGEEETLQIEVTLGENPDEPGKGYLGVEYWTIPSGAKLKEIHPFRYFTWPESEGESEPFDRFPFTFPPFRRNLPTLPEGVGQAVIIGLVTQDSPADQAGLKAADLITHVDGEPVDGPAELVERVQDKEPGDEITLTVYRAGAEEPIEITAVLGEHPDESGRAYLGVTISGFIRLDQESSKAPEAFRYDSEMLPPAG